MPNYLQRGVKTIYKQPRQSRLAGLLLLVVTPIVAVLLLVSVVGAAVGGWLLANYLFVWIFLQLRVALFATHYLLGIVMDRQRKERKTRWEYLLAFVVLALVLAVLPYWLTFLLGCFVLGACLQQDRPVIKEQL
jgi:Na+-translocating ferredoxin:NAD+ oxidoreductase RnfD subunit